MSLNEGQRVEDMRYELGRDAAAKGEPLHGTASEEFKHGYSSHKGFGSNVTPRMFGKGREGRKPWTCLCGTENRRYRNQCAMCGLSRLDAIRAAQE